MTSQRKAAGRVSPGFFVTDLAGNGNTSGLERIDHGVASRANGWRLIEDDGEIRGGVETRLGIVIADSFENKAGASTHLLFVHRGRRYTAVLDRAYSARGLVSVARRFAERVVAWAGE